MTHTKMSVVWKQHLNRCRTEKRQMRNLMGDTDPISADLINKFTFIDKMSKQNLGPYLMLCSVLLQLARQFCLSGIIEITLTVCPTIIKIARLAIVSIATVICKYLCSLRWVWPRSPWPITSWAELYFHRCTTALQLISSRTHMISAAVTEGDPNDMDPHL